jgi:hypothetical protein
MTLVVTAAMGRCPEASIAPALGSFVELRKPIFSDMMAHTC